MEENTPAPVRTATLGPVLRGMTEEDADGLLARVKAYLPSNYTAVFCLWEILIVGRDNAGWTLDGYVLPRLASGLIFATETGR